MIELAAWDDLDIADEMARWLDGLPVVWLRNNTDVQEDEEEHWTCRAVGISRPPVQAFAASMLSIFSHLSPEQASDGLNYSSLPALVRGMRRRPVEPDRHLSLGAAAMFRRNRQLVKDAGWTKKMKAQNLAAQRTAYLRRLAEAAWARVLGKGDPQAALIDPATVPAALVALVASERTALPVDRVQGAFNDGLAAVSAARAAGSKRDRQLRSAVYDLGHVSVGASYCDVFTCDRLVDGWLGDTRTNALGLARQLSIGGDGLKRFVDRLIATHP